MSNTSGIQERKVQPGAQPCFQLIYRSHSLLSGGGAVAGGSAGRTADAGVAEILRVARANNARLGITGALVLYDDWFAQVLEGPEAAVAALFKTIKADKRHDGLELDASGTVESRLFERWSMALVAEHGQPDMPVVATVDGLAEGAPWKVSPRQEKVLTRLRDLTRGYGRGS